MNIRKQAVAVLLFFIAFPIMVQSAASAGKAASGKFVNTLLVYYGAAPRLDTSLIRGFEPFDMVVIDRFRFPKVNGNTWQALKAQNPHQIVLVYQMGPQISLEKDDLPVIGLNGLGRYEVSRGHSRGDIKNDNPEFILKNTVGNELLVSVYETDYQLDFGDSGVQEYWYEATKADVVTQPWRGDGVMIDNCTPYHMPLKKKLVMMQSKKYPDAASWDKAMNSFVNSIVRFAHADSQLVMTNRGHSRTQTGREAWLSLDASDNPPDYVLEEGAFAVSYGKGDVQFFSEDDWFRQITTPREIKNSSVAFISHTDLDIGESGYDSHGRKVSFDEFLTYSLASYLLAKNDDGPMTYFSIAADRKNGQYNRNSWLDVYKHLDLGPAYSGMYKRDGIYVREFEKGFVLVNPHRKDKEVSVMEGVVGRYTFTPEGLKNEGAIEVRPLMLKANRALVLSKERLL